MAKVSESLIVKLLGSVAGAALALVFVPPKTLTGFIRRLSAALIFGTVFAPYVREWAAFSNDWEGMLGAACLSAMVSWAAMGAIMRVIGAWQGPKKVAGVD